MALITVLDREDRSVVVHSSIFDLPPRIPWQSPEERQADWAKVWARADAEKSDGG